MKKFVFRLSPLVRVKQTKEKEQKELLRAAMEKVRQIESELYTLKAHRQTTQDKLRGHSGALSGWELKQYSNYFDYIKDKIEQKQAELIEAKLKLKQIQDELYKLINELKVLDKIKAEKYQEYLKEVAKEDELAIGDIISFNVTSA